MDIKSIVGIVILAVSSSTGLLMLFFKTFIKSTVSESIKHQFEVERQKLHEEYERGREDRERKDRFQLAALDARLEAHQRAYSLARKLSNTIHSGQEEKFEIQREFTQFWNERCLYLTKEAREALWVASVLHADYGLYLLIWKEKRQPNAEKELLNAYNKIIHTIDIIEAGVDLEAMSKCFPSINGKRITAFGVEEKEKESKL
jgi:hypothetical protein